MQRAIRLYRSHHGYMNTLQLISQQLDITIPIFMMTHIHILSIIRARRLLPGQIPALISFHPCTRTRYSWGIQGDINGGAELCGQYNLLKDKRGKKEDKKAPNELSSSRLRYAHPSSLANQKGKR